MAVCPHCKEDLPSDMFFKNSHRKNGLSILCKPCFTKYEATPDRRAKRTWNTINARSGAQQSYEHVSVSMTRDEFLAWAIPAYTSWMQRNKGETPSLDRINPNGNYSLDNLRILERGENNRLSRNHPNVHAPLGMAWCHECAEYLPASLFWRCSGAYNSLQKRCKSCQTAAIKRSHNLRAHGSSATPAP